MSDTDSRIDPADAREFEGAMKADTGSTPHREESGGTYVVPELGTRLVAALIDGVVAFVAGFVPGVGAFLGAAYLVTRDGLPFGFADGRSIGKKVMQLRPVRLNGRAMDLQTSVTRNWMFGFGGVIALIAFLPLGPFGWLLILPVSAVALALSVYEVYKAITDPQQRRFGDELAGTRVVLEGRTGGA